MAAAALALAAMVGALPGAPAAPAAAAVEVQARVDRRSLAVGETATLDVVVRGALTGVREPEIDVPFGLALLGSSRTQSFSSVNGQMSVEVVFRYEIAAQRPGSYRLGPIRVRVGSQVYESPAAALAVTPSRSSIAQGGAGPASLLVDVQPADPYIGQPVVMRVRLIQRVPLAEDPSYTPPPTPGFWSERASQPESYYAEQSGTRVLVTETRTRLYPLAAGPATIGAASATLVLTSSANLLDPLQWLGARGAPARRNVTVQSQPVELRVRALPEPPPAGFTGAVGSLDVGWRADRGRTHRDVPVTAWLEVRGVGNLPLMRAPEIRTPGFEQFASTVEDSLATPGTLGRGLRRFQWTLLPLRQGHLTLEPPDLVWFDPADGQYYRSGEPALAVAVGPPQHAGAPEEEVFPAVFTQHPADPFRRHAQPWAFALAGLALGLAARLWWSSVRPPPDHVDRAQQREWQHAVARSTGPDFWAAAVRACEWLDQHGQPVQALRRQLDASRYGGTRANAEAIQREILLKLGQAIPERQPVWTLRLGAAGLAVAAVALVALLGPRGGEERGAARAAAADHAARGGELDRARSQWESLWREGGRSAGLAARLAWVEIRSGAIGPAALWALRGDREEPRDPALEWVIGKIRETGGLGGYTPARFPIRSLEWAVLAFLVGAGAVWLWPRRLPTAAAGAALLAAALLHPVQGWRSAAEPRGVVRQEVRLEGSDVALEAGQVVTVLERRDGRARARAGAGIDGWLPSEALALLEPAP